MLCVHGAMRRSAPLIKPECIECAAVLGGGIEERVLNASAFQMSVFGK